MRYQGKIIKWYDDKGFGFIRAAVDSKDVFLHISQIHKLKKRPEINELVTYEVTKDEKGRFRAVNVAYLVAQDNSRKSDNSTSFSFSSLCFHIHCFCT
jgi:cold shock CspA family protein